MLGGIVSARAAEPPDNVETKIADAVQSCKDLEGVPMPMLCSAPRM